MIHVVLVGGTILCLTAVIVERGFQWVADASTPITTPVTLTYVCCLANFLVGLMVLPSKELAPWIFTPIIVVLVNVLKKLVDHICPSKWRTEVNGMLNQVLKIEDEEERRKPQEGDENQRQDGGLGHLL